MAKYTLIFVVVLFLHLTAFAQLAGTVVKVSDGDTFTLLTAENRQIKIRLHGVDCPERKQDFGLAAKKFTSDRVAGKIVKVKELDKDRYGRTIGMVYLADGKILNEELLSAGLAWHYKRYDSSPKWAKLELQARSGKRGLWRQPNAIAPWEFRKMKRKK